MGLRAEALRERQRTKNTEKIIKRFRGDLNQVVELFQAPVDQLQVRFRRRLKLSSPFPHISWRFYFL